MSQALAGEEWPPPSTGRTSCARRHVIFGLIFAIALSPVYFFWRSEVSFAARGDQQPPAPSSKDIELVFSGGASARLIRLNQPPGARVEIDSLREGPAWQVQLVYPGQRVEEGRSYRLSFRARAENGRKIHFGLAEGSAPWDELASFPDTGLTGEWREHHLDFRSNGSDDDARLYVDLGQSKAAAEIADVKVSPTKGTEPVSSR